MQVPYRVVVEPQEFDNYAKYVDPSKILTLPFSNLGQGSIPARNWVWEHAISEGHKRHWIFDDNILCFYRLNANRRIPVDSGTIFRVAEIFTDRYDNVGLSGLNYTTFAQDRSERIPPYYLNTRVYSMILVKNDLPHRWRGKYNEDTDLCLRVLKDDMCTILFNAFLGDKTQTMIMGGGNTDEVYNTGDSRLAFAKSLEEQHPDVVRVVWKFGRWHHQVDYSRFKALNKLKFSEGKIPTDGINNYGMVLKRVKG